MSPRPSPYRPTDDELADMYLVRKMSTHQIARTTGFSRRSIVRWIEKSGRIKPREPEEVNISLRKHPIPERNTLYQLYWAERFSLNEIGKVLGASGSWVWELMKKYGISRRTAAEAGVDYPKTSFSGNPIDRAYLIGLRTGDLHATIDGNQVRIDTSTTHPAMWELVSSCFGKYGRVNRTPSKWKDGFQWMVYGYLDKSFDFLLTKPQRVPKEIISDRVLFLSFLSGYIDAEGNLRIFRNENKVGVSFRINSEDEGILRDIRDALRTMGYHVYFALGEEKGTRNGKTYRKRLWTLGMFRKNEVIELLGRLTLRHHEKIRWAALIVLGREKSWHSFEPLVSAHKEKVRRGVLRFVGEAERQYRVRHERKRD